jgi:endonuclease/exonuclease/phosphatase family metal-dependent hydrolase
MTRAARILTLNTARNQGDYPRRMDIIVSALKRSNADIVLLQECFIEEAGEADTARTIANALGLAFVAHPTRRKVRAWRGSQVMSSSALAVLTHAPIAFATTLSLPPAAGDGERMAQYVGVDLDGAPMLIVNTHLTHLPGAEGVEARRAQFRALFAHMTRCAGGRAMVLGGDLNAELSAVDSMAETAGLRVDSGPVASADLPPTLLGGLDYIANPPRAVDHIVGVSLPGVLPRIRILSRERLLEAPEPDGARASDHAAVLVTFEWQA